MSVGISSSLSLMKERAYRIVSMVKGIAKKRFAKKQSPEMIRTVQRYPLNPRMTKIIAK